MADGLRLGAVVQHTEGRGRSPERGVVIWADGRGVAYPAPMMADDRYIIQRGAGLYTVGNAVAEWVPVEEMEWTIEERVISASLRWHPPEWPEPSENDSIEFALLRALLSPAQEAEVFGDFSWPTSNYELAIEIARWLDSQPSLVSQGDPDGQND
jgi:hypothetical protein